ncbi:hypothetical protein HDU80_010880 [Chytriomyces hyalinus]|nr:hypothetical protein HDU80_010880 [Chytriomyces hyalinus]
MNNVFRVLARRQHTAASRVPCGGLATVEETRSSLPEAVAKQLVNYPSLITLPVQWGDQDAYGHVNNVSYMRYFESGRIAYFDQVIGTRLSPKDHADFIQGKRVGPILKKASISYRRVVQYPDTLTVGVRIDPKSVGKDRFDQEFLLVSHGTGSVVADGRATVVTFDYEKGTKADIPPLILRAFEDSQTTQQQA